MSLSLTHNIHTDCHRIDEVKIHIKCTWETSTLWGNGCMPGQSPAPKSQSWPIPQRQDCFQWFIYTAAAEAIPVSHLSKDVRCRRSVRRDYDTRRKYIATTYVGTWYSDTSYTRQTKTKRDKIKGSSHCWHSWLLTWGYQLTLHGVINPPPLTLAVTSWHRQ